MEDQEAVYECIDRSLAWNDAFDRCCRQKDNYWGRAVVKAMVGLTFLKFLVLCSCMSIAHLGEHHSVAHLFDLVLQI